MHLPLSKRFCSVQFYYNVERVVKISIITKKKKKIFFWSPTAVMTVSTLWASISFWWRLGRFPQSGSHTYNDIWKYRVLNLLLWCLRWFSQVWQTGEEGNVSPIQQEEEGLHHSSGCQWPITTSDIRGELVNWRKMSIARAVQFHTTRFLL